MKNKNLCLKIGSDAFCLWQTALLSWNRLQISISYFPYLLEPEDLHMENVQIHTVCMTNRKSHDPIWKGQFLQTEKILNRWRELILSLQKTSYTVLKT